MGAILAATDPVAVVAILEDIGAPQRIKILVEGESLLNDGLAIFVYQILRNFVLVVLFCSQFFLQMVGLLLETHLYLSNSIY